LICRPVSARRSTVARLGGTVICVGLLIAISVGSAEAGAVAPIDISVTTPPVAVQTIAGQTVTATFVVTTSAAGPVAITPTGIGRSPAFIIRAPTGATVTVKAARIAGVPAGAPTRVEVADRAGPVIATCFTAVTAGGAIAIPAACQVPGSQITLFQGISLQIGLPPGQLPLGGGIPGAAVPLAGVLGLGFIEAGIHLRRNRTRPA